MHAWDQFLERVEQELGKSTVDKWVRPLKVIRFDALNLYLEAQDTFQILWFEEHIRQKALKEFFNNNHKPIKIHLSTQSQGKTANQKYKQKVEGEKISYTFKSLDPSCRMSHFIFSKENVLAEKLFGQLVQVDFGHLPEFNPIYIYGPKGCGKSHLLMASAAHFHSKGLKAIYSTSDLFTDHLVSALRAADMSRFREVWRACDVLLLDDVEHFAKRGATQEEFFHTFNALHLAGKQIILSSNVPPQELAQIEPRLVSRFEWGIVVPLKPLPKENFPLMLQKKADALKVQLPPKVAAYLIDFFQSSPKALMQGLEALILRMHLEKESFQTLNHLSPLSLKKILSDLLKMEEQALITPSKIIGGVAQVFQVGEEEVRGKSQARECIEPRKMAMYLCRQMLKMPYTKIGEAFDRDHSTVMSAVRQVEKNLKEPNSSTSQNLQLTLKKIKS